LGTSVVPQGSHLGLLLVSFYKWCKVNLRNLNCPKWKVMTFYRHLPHIISYTLNLVPLNRLDEVNDLGILLDHKLKFDKHLA